MVNMSDTDSEWLPLPPPPPPPTQVGSRGKVREGCRSREHAQLYAAAFKVYDGSTFSTCCSLCDHGSHRNYSERNDTDLLIHLFTNRETVLATDSKNRTLFLQGGSRSLSACTFNTLASVGQL